MPHTGRTMVTGGASDGAASACRGGRHRTIATITLTRWMRRASPQNAAAAEMRIVIPARLAIRGDSAMTRALTFAQRTMARVIEPQHGSGTSAAWSATRLPRRDGRQRRASLPHPVHLRRPPGHARLPGGTAARFPALARRRDDL